MKIHHLLLATITLLSLSINTSSARKFDIKESLAHYTPVLTDEFKAMLRNADIEAGAEYFDQKCSTCHDHKKGGIHNKGPLLWNMFGRKAGSISEFKYSDAMKNSGHTWNFATLNYYLTRTDRAVPGRIMNFRGIRQDQKRANLLAYLRQFNDNPPALP
ncbi:MAG: c-type cytochrome [Gammaproteobacteria bacterium]|nr:c-type cytochrome [Gammaproteobacteria bacterium]